MPFNGIPGPSDHLALRSFNSQLFVNNLDAFYFRMKLMPFTLYR